MTEIDFQFHKRRAREEFMLAKAACDPLARKEHLRVARLHEDEIDRAVNQRLLARTGYDPDDSIAGLTVQARRSL